MSVLSVTRLLTDVRRMLEPNFHTVEVRGELSNLTRQASGHLYFVLKDARSQMRCVMLRAQAGRLEVPLNNGMRVVLTGAVRIYPDKGDLQFLVREAVPDGVGQLHIALERLKRQLAQEGLFDDKRKRPVPALPRRVGVVTSLQGAVLRDIWTVVKRRNPAVQLILSPSAVQGPDAPQELRHALERLRRSGVDCVVLARGGGSLEDLMPFNAESLVRYLAGYPIPTISAVGHETDFTLTDLVCDLRAPTPTAAAERIAPERDKMLQALANIRARLNAGLLRTLAEHRRRLQQLSSAATLRFPYRGVQQRRTVLEQLRGRLFRALEIRAAQQAPLRENLQTRLHTAMRTHLEREQRQLQALQASLQALSPQRVLDRGYAMAVDGTGRPITTVDGRRVGEGLELRLADGSLACTVDHVRRNP